MDFAGMETLSFSQVCAVPPDTARSFVSNRCWIAMPPIAVISRTNTARWQERRTARGTVSKYHLLPTSQAPRTSKPHLTSFRTGIGLFKKHLFSSCTELQQGKQLWEIWQWIFFFFGAEMVFQWYNTTPNTKWELIAEFNPSPPLTNTWGRIEEAGICTSNADMMAHLNKLWAKNFSVLGIKIKFRVLKESHNSWIRLTLFQSAAIWGESP